MAATLPCPDSVVGCGHIRVLHRAHVFPRPHLSHQNRAANWEPLLIVEVGEERDGKSFCAWGAWDLLANPPTPFSRGGTAVAQSGRQ